MWTMRHARSFSRSIGAAASTPNYGYASREPASMAGRWSDEHIAASLNRMRLGARIERRYRLHARCTGSDDPNGDRHAEARHLIENVASDLCLGPLIRQSPGMKTPTDGRFV